MSRPISSNRLRKHYRDDRFETRIVQSHRAQENNRANVIVIVVVIAMTYTYLIGRILSEYFSPKIASFYVYYMRDYSREKTLVNFKHETLTIKMPNIFIEAV